MYTHWMIFPKQIISQDLPLTLIPSQYWMYLLSKTINTSNFPNWMHMTNACSIYLLDCQPQAGSKNQHTWMPLLHGHGKRTRLCVSCAAWHEEWMMSLQQTHCHQTCSFSCRLVPQGIS